MQNPQYLRRPVSSVRSGVEPSFDPFSDGGSLGLCACETQAKHPWQASPGPLQPLKMSMEDLLPQDTAAARRRLVVAEGSRSESSSRLNRCPGFGGARVPIDIGAGMSNVCITSDVEVAHPSFAEPARLAIIAWAAPRGRGRGAREGTSGRGDTQASSPAPQAARGLAPRAAPRPLARAGSAGPRAGSIWEPA